MATSTGLRLDGGGGSPTSTAPATPLALDATTTSVAVGAASVVLPKKSDKSGLYSTTLGDSPMTATPPAAATAEMGAMTMTTLPPHLPPPTPNTSSAGTGDANDDGRALALAGAGGGVPGFPDFPACWVGEEGGARPRRGTPPSRGSRKRAEKRAARRTRMTSSAVNSTARTLLRSFRKNQKRMVREERRMHREERRCLREGRRKSKRDLADISRGLASLKCS